MTTPCGRPVPTERHDRPSPDGVPGDSRDATEEGGQAILGAAVTRTVTFVRPWLSA